MGSLIFLFTIFLSCALVSGIPSWERIYPNFTASHFQFIGYSGSFLFSRNGIFKAAMYNSFAQQTNFYLCIIHAPSNTIVWSANRDAPVSVSGKMTLTVSGIIINQDGSLKWSTPPQRSPVSALELTETGNLVLLDRSNKTLWESFSNPTDTVVIGQRLYVGTSLSSAVSDIDLSTGDYSLSVIVSDAILQWKGQSYWKLSMDTQVYRNSNHAVEYMVLNQTGLFLFGHNSSVIVVQMNLSPSDFRIAKLDYSGQFIIHAFTATEQKEEFAGPADKCWIPSICGRIGLCTDDTASDSPVCSCPSNFRVASHNKRECLPSDGSYLFDSSCNSANSSNMSKNSLLVSYLSLGYAVEYFAKDFTAPVKYGVNLSICQDLCSSDCSCLGMLFENKSGSCFELQNDLGSFRSSTENESNLVGFIKTLPGPFPNAFVNNDLHGQSLKFPVVGLVLLPFTGIFLLVTLGFLWWRRYKHLQSRKVKSGHLACLVSEELDAFSIPGLPVRFKYEDLASATENFKTQIGSGGFGAVYKGRLADGTLVAVKRISNLGVQGKKDFCTEIAIIGRVHHVNLVKLIGFCTHGTQGLLVYEYMNRGSLDCTLFGNGPVIEWQERVGIALGIARGLAYLHSGCDKKILHCDIKPENILLQDHFQAKVSDFGLSKLLNPEESSLFTTMRGTRGYLAPEWLTNSAISDKTDVYSFGMVILELVSGRKNCSLRAHNHSIDADNCDPGPSPSSSGQGPTYFPLFALEMHEQRRYLELADPRLEGRVTGDDVEKLVRVALCCLHEEPAFRPTMVSVVGMLDGEISLCRPRMESLDFLRFYGHRFAEASMIEESSRKTDAMFYTKANTFRIITDTQSGSNFPLSFVSSEQISGPR